MTPDGLRVAMVCPYSLSRPGGVQGQVLGLARGLRGRGHQVTVVAPGDEPAPGGEAPGAGVRTVVVGRTLSLPANGSRAPVTLSPLAAARAARLAGRGFHVVHLHEPLAPVVGWGCLASHRAPLVGTFHRSGSGRLYPLLRPLAIRALGRLSARVAVSEEAAVTANDLAPGEYRVLFNGVEVDRFASAAPWPGSGPTLLFLGRHEPRKGLEVLLEAFAARLAGTGATLWVAGDGPATADLRRRYPASEHLRWLGVLSESEVASRLAGADVLCAPSLYGESFGMVVLEGMAAGCTVVASDIPGYRAAAGGHAVLVAPGNAGAWARALHSLLGSLAAGEGACSKEAREAAREHAARWSMDELAARYEAVYEQVLLPAGSGGPR